LNVCYSTCRPHGDTQSTSRPSFRWNERRDYSAHTPSDPALLDHSLSDTLDDYERTLIARALSVTGGNVAEAARRLKTDRPNLYRRMRRLGIAVGSAVE
jgi:transcriptional regulator with GAF, ATPase, and Fis domain